MRLQIVLAALVLFTFSIIAPAQQESVANLQTEQNNYPETRLFDEFGPTSHCDLGARIQNIYIEVSQNPDTRAYIIFYRGADSLPARQTEAAAQRHMNRIRDQIMFLNLKSELFEMVDGGFRQTDTIWNEVFIVPKGGAIPKPSGTVEKSKLPADKAYKVDENGLYVSEAQIVPAETVADEETVQSSEENPATTEEVTEENAPIENSENPAEETSEMDEYSEEYDPYDWISDYFAEQLRGDKKLRGVVIFYTDETEYDFAKLRTNIDEGMRKSAEKSKVDLSGVKVIYGGYRKDSKIEFWIVPPGAKEPQPTPEEKIESEL
jgi:hypothetical protein